MKDTDGYIKVTDAIMENGVKNDETHTCTLFLPGNLKFEGKIGISIGDDSLVGHTDFKKFNDTGHMLYADGNWFEGTFIQGKPWKGKFNYEDGSWFEGTFIQGKPWKGKFNYEDGSWFEGTLNEEKPWEGRCKLNYEDGSWFEGTLKKGIQDKGYIQYNDINWFEGTFNDDNPYKGYGVLKGYSGAEVHEGHFKKGLLHTPEGKSDGKSVARETISWNNGNKVSGKFTNGEISGPGSFTRMDRVMDEDVLTVLNGNFKDLNFITDDDKYEINYSNGSITRCKSSGCTVSGGNRRKTVKKQKPSKTRKNKNKR